MISFAKLITFKAMEYRKVKSLQLENTCVGCTIHEWEVLMAGHKRACKKEIDRLVKIHLPDLYYDLALNYYNPYNYHKTETHLILVHSGIEYFLKPTL
jgi:hypothetical protein